MASSEVENFTADGKGTKHPFLIKENQPFHDIYVFPEALNVQNSNPPLRKLFQNDGGTTDDSGIRLESSRGLMTGYAAANAVLSAGVYTIEFWAKPENVNFDMITFADDHRFTLRSTGELVIRVNDRTNTGLFFNVGAWNHCVAVVDAVGRSVSILLNGVWHFDIAGADVPNLDASYQLCETGDVCWFDKIQVFDALLTESQSLELWNSGAGGFVLPTGIVDTDRVLYCDIEDASDGTLTNTKGNDFILSGVEDVDYSWELGAFGGTGSFGVFLQAFEAGKKQYAGLNISPPHSHALIDDNDKEQGYTAMRAHVHVATTKQLQAGDTIKFGIEYTGSDVGGTFPVTQTAIGTYTATGEEPIRKHIAFAITEIDMTSFKNVSPHFAMTIFRTDDDTFDGDVFLLNKGEHIQVDVFGSRQEYVK
jgi:hypothetical protein